ncbi:hypothetical protein GCM10025868_30050 [Angustibacter aerolatus]|uniref:Uncharacterized protein n=1 Tax=Angustibacter aerolatus TaxID=1162965 RepID=A0ABQ6JKH3_9ACTN|nr:hypothetical protein [Angustibacter aerolatus]GMA87755.1 hypothetical protein GCM10025868_30050 [Angustibacter aerolatus]
MEAGGRTALRGASRRALAVPAVLLVWVALGLRGDRSVLGLGLLALVFVAALVLAARVVWAASLATVE